MLIIRHRAGVLKGREQSIDDTKDTLVFGRDSDVCDVIFPADETLVSRRHFALERKLSGAWTIDLYGDPYVAVNGQPAENGQALHRGDLVELGKRGGPGFEIVQLGDGNAAKKMAATQVQEKVTNPRLAVAGAKRTALIGTALALLIAVGGTAGIYYWSAGQGARLDQAVATLAETQAKAAADTITQTVRDKLLAASYLVYIRQPGGQEQPAGSASPIAGNLLATNAHVAALSRDLKDGQKLYVKAPGAQGRTFEVVDFKIHPGYAEFEKFLESDPLYVTSTSNCKDCFAPILSGTAPGYDVAILRVADGSNLSPILEIASERELAAIGPGTPLAMSGYPLERIGSQTVQSVAATPTLSLGMVSANTDLFNLPAEPAQRKLIQHNLPGTGGNSGSPMVTPNGKIVGLHNAGSYVDVPNVGRVPNAAMIRFGQRSDMLADLVADRAEQSLTVDRAYWAKQTAAFKRGFDYWIPEILDRSKPSEKANAVPASQSKHTLTSAEKFTAKDKDGKDTNRRQKIHSVNLKAGQGTTWIAYAQEKQLIQMYLVVDGKIVKQDERRIWFPFMSVKSDKDIKAEVYVVSPDNDTSYTFLEYTWDEPRS